MGSQNSKRKEKSKLSYTTNNQNGTIDIVDSKYIKLPKLKEVRCKIHRQIPDTHIIKSATISKTGSGKYFISILTEYEKEDVIANLDKKQSIRIRL